MADLRQPGVGVATDHLRHFGARMVLVALALVPLGCSEKLLTEANSSSAPTVNSKTMEVSLRAKDFVAWRDTTYTGYATPASAGFALAADEPDLRARALVRFSNVPDSFTVDTVTFAVDSFLTASIRLAIDTARSELAAGLTVTVDALERGFDSQLVTWTQASAGVPWTSPGGDLGAQLGSKAVSIPPDSAAPDTVLVPLSQPVDSLLKAWRTGGGEPGAALLVTGPRTTLRIQSLALQTRARLRAGSKDTVAMLFVSARPLTFIYDPPPPAVGTALRVAGLPASRAYMQFVLPDTFNGVPLRGSIINLARIRFFPLAAAGAPFTLSESLSLGAVTLLLDPFVTGPRTPIGGSIGTLVVGPDSLAAGGTMQFDITGLVANWASSDSSAALRLGIQALPDGQTIDFQDFGSAENAPGLQPQLQLLVTPRAPFRLP